MSRTSMVALPSGAARPWGPSSSGRARERTRASWVHRRRRRQAWTAERDRPIACGHGPPAPTGCGSHPRIAGPGAARPRGADARGWVPPTPVSHDGGPGLGAPGFWGPGFWGPGFCGRGFCGPGSHGLGSGNHGFGDPGSGGWGRGVRCAAAVPVVTVPARPGDGCAGVRHHGVPPGHHGHGVAPRHHGHGVRPLPVAAPAAWAGERPDRPVRGSVPRSAGRGDRAHHHGRGPPDAVGRRAPDHGAHPAPGVVRPPPAVPLAVGAGVRARRRMVNPLVSGPFRGCPHVVPTQARPRGNAC